MMTYCSSKDSKFGLIPVILHTNLTNFILIKMNSFLHIHVNFYHHTNPLFTFHHTLIHLSSVENLLLPIPHIMFPMQTSLLLSTHIITRKLTFLTTESLLLMVANSHTSYYPSFPENDSPSPSTLGNKNLTLEIFDIFTTKNEN